MTTGISENRRIVLIGSYAPSLTVFRGAMIVDLARRGYQVFALAPDIDSNIAGELRRMGAVPRTISVGRTSLDPIAAWRSQRDLSAVIAEIAPAAIIAYTIKPIIFGARASRAARVPQFIALITGLGYAFTGRPDTVKRMVSRAMAWLLYKSALRHATLILFQNPDDRADFRRLRLIPPHVRVERINGSGVDLKHYAPARLPDALSFLMVCRLLGDKGVREYAVAARRMKQRHPKVRVMLAGFLDSSPDSLTSAELERIVADGIEFLGRLEDVRPAIAACSVYVLPSYREGTPRSVLEAMSMGRPIITTDAPGCRETVIDGETGILIPPRDADALFGAMARFVAEPEMVRQWGEASRRLAEERFDVHRVNAAIFDFAGL